MNRYIIALRDADGKNRDLVGNKAACLARMIGAGISVPDGVRITEFTLDRGVSLSDGAVGEVYTAMQRLEELFGAPQDVEWTIQDENLYLLQSRPVALQKEGDKGWYLSLHRSLDNLQRLEARIEGEILPGMEADAREMEQVDLTELTADALANEVERRGDVYKKWHDVYWDECIPFAHGVRLFATVYNDRMCPEDPYEFIDVILPRTMKCLERNIRIQRASEFLRENPQCVDGKGLITDSDFREVIDEIINELQVNSGGTDSSAENVRLVINLIRQMADRDLSAINPRQQDRNIKADAFIASFP